MYLYMRVFSYVYTTLICTLLYFILYMWGCVNDQRDSNPQLSRLHLSIMYLYRHIYRRVFSLCVHHNSHLYTFVFHFVRVLTHQQIFGLSAIHVMKDTTGTVSNRIHLGVANHLQRIASFSFKISITLSSSIFTMLVKHTVSLHEFYVR